MALTPVADRLLEIARRYATLPTVEERSTDEILGYHAAAAKHGMTPNQRTVDTYMDGFRRTDRELILSCLTDDVRWLIPGVFDVQGKDAFAGHIVDEGFTGAPEITVTRLVEADDVVVAEGSVRAPRADGTVMSLVFCDVFEMRDGKIRALTSYLMETKTAQSGSDTPGADS